jgi:hypothetical protein
VYGGYSKGLFSPYFDGWYVQLRVDRSSCPNKLAPRGEIKRLGIAQDLTVACSLLFLALCLIKNKTPEHMEMYDL